MGEVHAWAPGGDATVCGLPLSRARLATFPHVEWADADPAGGGMADRVNARCRRCTAVASPRARGRRLWARFAPRPSTRR